MIYARFVLAWALFGAALLLDKLCYSRIYHDSGIGWRLFQLNQWCFSKSSDVQGSGSFGPWDTLEETKQKINSLADAAR